MSPIRICYLLRYGGVSPLKYCLKNDDVNRKQRVFIDLDNLLIVLSLLKEMFCVSIVTNFIIRIKDWMNKWWTGIKWLASYQWRTCRYIIIYTRINTTVMYWNYFALPVITQNLSLYIPYLDNLTRIERYPKVEDMAS